MAIELKLTRTDSATPWGFRLVGGTDFGQPIVVVKVNEKSLAEDAGLEVGDIVVRVNDTSTAGLTHEETHGLIVSAGLEFELGIRRGANSTQIINDETYNYEDVKMIREELEENIINEAVEKINRMNIQDSEEKSRFSLSENLAGQEEMIITSVLQTAAGIKQGKKWSTFLVKPDKPVPKPKRKVEEEKAKGEPYRVVIKKQQRRPSQDKKVQFDNVVTEMEVDAEEVEEDDTNISSEQAEEVEVEVVATDATVEETNTNEEYERDEVEEEMEEVQTKGASETHTLLPDTTSESSTSLETQLLAVQKQLQALSQLPSAIQLTLDAVSKQLASIVGARNSCERNEDRSSSTKEEDEPLTEEEVLDEVSVSEKAEAELTRDRDETEDNSSIEEELEEDAADERVEEDREQEEDLEEGEDDPYGGLTEEEREDEVKREEAEAKQEKAMDERTLKPIQRPIILPGGRKWSTPDDAIPSFRKPKMSEEKIVETLESNLEEMFGKRKGINFLKYQPPPKNLDYLQRSEVYRLVHDMEPPVKGIVSRPEKVAAAQDYYEATKGAP